MFSLAIDTFCFIRALLRVCMIFLPTFIANFLFSAVEFSVTKLLTLIASDWIRDKLGNSHPVVTHPDVFWQGLMGFGRSILMSLLVSYVLPEDRYPVQLYDTFIF